VSNRFVTEYGEARFCFLKKKKIYCRDELENLIKSVQKNYLIGVECVMFEVLFFFP